MKEYANILRPQNIRAHLQTEDIKIMLDGRTCNSVTDCLPSMYKVLGLIPSHTHTQAHTHTYTYKHTRTNRYIHTKTHTHTYTHKHICTNIYT